MRTLLGLLVVAGCVPHVDGPRVDEMPFLGAPAVSWTDDPGSGYHVELSVALQRDVTPGDKLAFVVRVADDDVNRFPVVGARGTTVRQRLDLPLGDYDVALDYQGKRFAGQPFRIAVVPEWGGGRALHLFRHHGTRVSLRERRLWVLRWWSNDAPALPWIIEWRHDGSAVSTTTGREQRWNIAGASAFVRYVAQPAARRSIWQLGEEYAVPDVVANTPGSWEARVIHAGAPPVAIAFTVLPGGAVGEAAGELIATPYGWTHAWSKPLALQAVAPSEIVELEDKLPVIAGAQRIDDGPIELTPSAVRALFRSKPLADSWTKLLGIEPTKARALRSQIEQLIKTHGGPWKPEEFPKS